MNETAIARTPVPVAQRSEFVDGLFGPHFPMQLEPYVFDTASRLSPDYHGGYWEFYQLGDGGFYMAPVADRTFEVVAPNGFVGRLSSDALGIAACLYAFSHGSFGTPGELAEACAAHYHQLREYTLQHSQADQLLGLTD